MAVVRGNSDKAAYSRLQAGYDSGDPELLQVFEDLARKHLRVHAGEPQPPSRHIAGWHERHHRPTLPDRMLQRPTCFCMICAAACMPSSSPVRRSLASLMRDDSIV